ncbi:ribosomal-protein-alanine N-acetyltransferase [Sinobacterium caligoides]|uniref:[Ribosomal protein bS18]-alanine N-acetyltransferase n=1 Tax=Sinobacterium caligoides TaxID=933926 RepID=A0A3N2E1B8_9GAMM|nr:ribosomal protein S18-alanine N-acetyltransferase [Sinobacterium caligoides]ROS05817.1 ribosomal-protein-alanine N-acetyltransferase [Sinobacterium caligoides]
MLIAGYQLRRATLQDADVMARLDREATPTAWSVQNFRDSLNAEDQCWLLMQGVEVVGSAISSIVLDEASLLNITICPKQQGQGLGRGLLEHLLEQASDNGALVCFLEVRESNQPAIALYLSSGFTQVGVRKNYYQLEDGREHALVMKRELSINVSRTI